MGRSDRLSGTNRGRREWAVGCQFQNLISKIVLKNNDSVFVIYLFGGGNSRGYQSALIIRTIDASGSKGTDRIILGNRIIGKASPLSIASKDSNLIRLDLDGNLLIDDSIGNL